MSRMEEALSIIAIERQWPRGTPERAVMDHIDQQLVPFIQIARTAT